MALRIRSPFTASFFSSTTATVAVDVPGLWPCALNGRGYLLDDKDPGEHVERTVPAIKGQAVTTDEPGDRTLNPEGAWRRSRSSWHHGAGQSYADDDSSDRFRFRSSKGIDVWTRGKLALLLDTSQAHTNASGALMCSSQGYLYYTDGNTVYRTDGTTRTACTGTPAATPTGIASLGASVYVAFGASGSYKITGTAGSAFVGATAVSGVGVAKQRILTWNTNTLYDESAGAATTVYQRTVDTSFAWAAVADGVAHIYAAGNSSTQGTIYRIAVVSDGSALGAPVVAGRLPEGETVASMFGYAGILFIGTSKGWRAAAQSSNGDLTIGPLVDLGVSVSSWSAWGQYVYFGWTNYDGSSTGAGRIDPTVLNDNGTYAYASDLMVTGSGAVAGLAHLGGNLYLGVTGTGIYKPSTSYVTSGSIDGGLFNFGIADQKLMLGMSVGSTGDTVTAYLSVDEGSFTFVSDSGYNQSGTYFEPRLTLSGDGSSTPVVRSLAMRSFPQAKNVKNLVSAFVFSNPLYLPEHGRELQFDIDTARDEIESLWANKTVTTYQEGRRSWAVTVEDYEFQKTDPTDDGTWQGRMVVKMKVVQ